VVVWFAAANFGALVVAVLVLVVAGGADGARLSGAVDVLRGSARAVPADEFAALKQARADLEGRGNEAKLMDAWTSYKAAKDDFDRRKVNERNALKTLEDTAKKAAAEIEDAHNAFKAAEAAKTQRERQEAATRRQDAFEKVRRVYRHMRPDEVARDLEARLAVDRAGEVADILRAMDDRAAAEALEAIADPASRIRIYDALAGVTRTAEKP
jgi:flagellar motility protein MotE (MotC chaperone)